MSQVQSPVLVRVEDPERMNLMGLLMRGLLETTANSERGRRIVRSLRGDVKVVAGSMAVTLCFSKGEVILRREAKSSPRASVSGEMKPLLEIVAGGGLVLPVLSGRVRVRGNLLMLLKMLPLIRAPKTA